MDGLVDNATLVHALAGVGVVLTGLIALTAPRGSDIHKTAGKVFAYSMLGALVLALPATLAHGDLGLGLLSPFLLYLTLTGLRSGQAQVTAVDRALPLLGFVVGAGLVVAGVWLCVAGPLPYGIGALAFGGLTATLAWFDRTRPRAYKARVRVHLGYMVGAFAAGLAGFSAANLNHFVPEWAIWGVPLVGGIFGIFWYRREFLG